MKCYYVALAVAAFGLAYSMAQAQSVANDPLTAAQAAWKQSTPLRVPNLSVRQLEKIDRSAEILGSWRGNSEYGRLGTPSYSAGPVTIRFDADGVVTTDDSGGPVRHRGNWKLDGDAIEITWQNGPRVRLKVGSGQISGSGTTEILTGRGTERIPWSLSFSKD